MLARFRARGDVRRRAACAGRGPQGDAAPCGPFLRFADIAVLHRSRTRHAPRIPEGVVPFAGPSRVLGRLRHRERRCARCRQAYASQGSSAVRGLGLRVR